MHVQKNNFFLKKNCNNISVAIYLDKTAKGNRLAQRIPAALIECA